jgi:C1A family cysteine protease
VIDLLRALQYGPVVVAHFVSEPFKFYSSGVFDGDGCDKGRLELVNHASVIVGYDLDAPIPYFKFQNSWADDWGENGFYRIKIGELTKQNTGVCLVAGTPFMVFADVE